MKSKPHSQNRSIRDSTMKLSFSLPSKSSSSSKPNLAKPAKGFNDKTLDHEGSEDSKQYVNEFDASKPLSETNGKSRAVVIAPIENEWRPLKKMKNLEAPLGQSVDESVLKFETVSGSDPADDSKMSYGLNVRQSVDAADVSKSGEVLPRPAPIEAVMLERFKADLERLPEDRGFEDFEDVSVESFAAALMEGYGWSKGRGIGRNAKEDVVVKEYNRRTDKQGLGFVDVPAGLPKKEVQKDKERERESNWDEGREPERNGDEGRERGRNRDEGREREKNRDEGREPERNRDDGRERERNRGESRVKENINRGRVKEYKHPESDGLAISKHVRIVGGRDAGLKGTIVEKPDPGWLILKLSKRDEVKVRVTDVAELGSKEEERFLRKLEEPEVENENKGQKKRKEVESVVEKKGENGKRDVEKRSSRLSWLTSHIRVRIISKDFKGGKFYLKKGKVVDVVGPSICDISIDESRELVQGVSQDLLETALPRRGGPVLVLYGKHKGVYGSLVERDLDKETGIVRDADSHELLNVHLEQIAEYIGDPSYLGY